MKFEGNNRNIILGIFKIYVTSQINTNKLKQFLLFFLYSFDTIMYVKILGGLINYEKMVTATIATLSLGAMVSHKVKQYASENNNLIHNNKQSVL